jgi:hypothetical protein
MRKELIIFADQAWRMKQRFELLLRLLAQPALLAGAFLSS